MESVLKAQLRVGVVLEAILEGCVKSVEEKVYLGKTPGLVCSETAHSQAEDWMILISGNSAPSKQPQMLPCQGLPVHNPPSVKPTLHFTPTPQSSLSALCTTP